eukprot:CAMPEP_0116829660 /NCGR_PEP_ID=MMETSP0418-20121206/4337_1 /TAXON_ID=1158023 /ORGANISM="Astrosyne radiata, Strain 13vi08-1A" /LENGTH=264 /DNA_ID=CAMNT_0004458689 /DNA_START=63 /DNA_END=858 /DNA_ORIENTATION=+
MGLDRSTINVSICQDPPNSIMNFSSMDGSRTLLGSSIPPRHTNMKTRMIEADTQGIVNKPIRRKLKDYTTQRREDMPSAAKPTLYTGLRSKSCDISRLQTTTKRSTRRNKPSRERTTTSTPPTAATNQDGRIEFFLKVPPSSKRRHSIHSDTDRRASLLEQYDRRSSMDLGKDASKRRLSEQSRRRLSMDGCVGGGQEPNKGTTERRKSTSDDSAGSNFGSARDRIMEVAQNEEEYGDGAAWEVLWVALDLMRAGKAKKAATVL